MNDFHLTKHNIQFLHEHLVKELEVNPAVIVSVQSCTTSKWGMARLWRMWIKTVSDWMAQNGATMPLVIKNGVNHGVRPFNADDGHELFTSHLLPQDQDGTRVSWSKSGRDGMRPSTKGERFHALRQLEQYAIERGIVLYKPQDSEYEQLRGEHD